MAHIVMDNLSCNPLRTLSEDAFDPVEVTESEHEKMEGLVSNDDRN